jgi:N-acetylmuramoyl-L-alanine amidase|nr:MAG TPA: Cell wall hydrolase autolysin [Caudoviricetes sp.]
MARHVFLSAGHGGSDPGAVAYGMEEKDINLEILLSCKAELERHGVKVTASRTADENDPVNEEVREANASRAEIAVSFHTNAGGGDGSETYYYAGNANGKRLAELCEKHVNAIGQNSRGVKTKNLAFTRDTVMTAVLCECSFIDHDSDNDIIDTAAERNAFGIAYAKAILEYLGIEYGGKPATPNPPKIDVDGWWGRATTMELQRLLGTVQDGIVSGQASTNRLYHNRCDTSSWQYGIGGSAVIRAFQKRLGVSSDGHFGPISIRGLQKRLGLSQDGYCGPLTVKAIQRWINDGLK